MRAALLIALAAALGCNNKREHGEAREAAPAAPVEAPAAADQTERIKSAIEQLESSDPEERRKGMGAISTIEQAKDLTVGEGLALIAAAGEPAARANDRFDAASELLSPLAPVPHKEFLDPLKRLVANTATQSGARGQAIVVIAAIDSPFAAAELLRDLRKYAADIGYRQPLSVLQTSPHQADVLFPHLFDLADVAGLETDVYSTATAYCLAHKLDAKALADSTPRILEAYRKAAAALGTGERPTKDGEADDRFLAARYHCAELIRLLGCLAPDATAADLATALQHTDRRVRLVAALARVQQGQPVAPEALDEIASIDELRGTLYEQLGKLGHPELFPTKWATQDLLAQSDLAAWLAFSDANRAPDQMALVKKIGRVDPETVKDVDYYLYRYRMATMRNGAWLVGVAGPYVRGGKLVVDGDATTSDFELFAGRTPEQHLKRLLDGD